MCRLFEILEVKRGEVTAKLKRIHTGHGTRGQTHTGTVQLPKHPRKDWPTTHKQNYWVGGPGAGR